MVVVIMGWRSVVNEAKKENWIINSKKILQRVCFCFLFLLHPTRNILSKSPRLGLT